MKHEHNIKSQKSLRILGLLLSTISVYKLLVQPILSPEQSNSHIFITNYVLVNSTDIKEIEDASTSYIKSENLTDPIKHSKIIKPTA